MNRTKALAELQRELGGTAAALPDSLGAADLQRLSEAVRAAKRAQRDTLKGAIDEGMGFVPALLRIPLKRILFP